MINLSLLRKMLMQTFKVCHVFVLIMGLLISPISHALEIKLGSSMNVRAFDDENSALSSVGVLAAGSVVEIPDRFKVVKRGKVDAEATFNKWLSRAGYSRSTINKKSKDARTDFYFPVRIVSTAKGSSGKHLIGKTRFMALRVLERSKLGLKVIKTARVYQGPRHAFPLKPGWAAPTDPKSVPRAAPVARPARSRATARTAKPDSQAYSNDQTTNSADNTPTPQGSPTEAAVPQSCPECDAARTDANSGTANAAELGTAVRDHIEPRAYDAEADGLQGLTAKFPAACQTFIKTDGTYGYEGQIALKELSRYSDAYLNASGMEKVCPNFNKPSFDEAQKRHFWIWLLAAVSAQEASCNPDSRASLRVNKNGHAAGLFQIEERKDLRAARDRVYGGTYCSGDPYNENVNTRCAVRMLETVIDNGNGPSARRNNYWSSLMHSGDKTHALISQYEACGAKPETVSKRRHHNYPKGRHGKSHSRRAR